MDTLGRIRADLDELYDGERSARNVVLFCDDDEGIRDMARDAFVPMVFAPIGLNSFLAVPDAEMAMAYLRDPARRKALAIICSDRDMPGISGTSFAIRLRHRGDIDERRIPFLLASAAHDESTRSGVDILTDTLMSTGIIDAALNKPFSIDEFTRSVAEAVQKRLSIIKGGRPS